jgi:hypothetical protein
MKLAEGMDIADNLEFWARLARRINRELRASRDNSIRFLWVDDFIPGSVELRLDRSQVLTSAWIHGDQQMGSTAQVTLHLDAAAAEAFRSGDWRGLLPADDAHGWLSVDKAAGAMTVTILGRALA